MRKMSLVLFLRSIQPPLDSIFKGRKNSGRLFRFLSFTEKPAQKAFLNLLDYVSTYACSTRHRVIASLAKGGGRGNQACKEVAAASNVLLLLLCSTALRKRQKRRAKREGAHAKSHSFSPPPSSFLFFLHSDFLSLD